MAATYDFTPLATTGANTVGTLETTAAIAMYIITVKDDSNTAIDLQTVDGVHGSLYDMILREVAPHMAWAPAAGNGLIYVVVDSASNSAETLQARVRQLASATPAVNDSTVTAGASFVIS
jgi:hypothetical protein